RRARPDRRSRGGGAAGLRHRGLCPLRVAARQLVDHRLRLRGAALVPGPADVAAVPARVRGRRDGDMGTRLIHSLGVSLLLCLPAAARAEDELIDSPMYQAPALPVAPVVTVFPEGLPALWLRALERPEVDLKYKAAEAIVLARRRGVKGLDATVGPLLA